MLFVTLALHWTKSIPSLHILTASVVIHTISCANSSSCCLLGYGPTSDATATLIQCFHYSLTRLLQLTLCWPPNWVITVPRPALRSVAHLSGRTSKFGHVSRYVSVFLNQCSTEPPGFSEPAPRGSAEVP